MNGPQAEAATVRAMLAGDERAFEQFYASYMPRVYRFILKRVGRDASAAEELCQDVLIRAIQSIGSYRGEASLFTWICQIARNRLTDYWRQRQRRDAVEAFPEDDPTIAAALETLEGNLPGPEAEGARAELLQLVEVVLDRLPPNYGDALEWKYIDGLSVAEIAQRLGLGATAAQSLLARARGAFRDAFSALAGEGHRDLFLFDQGGGT